MFESLTLIRLTNQLFVASMQSDQLNLYKFVNVKNCEKFIQTCKDYTEIDSNAVLYLGIFSLKPMGHESTGVDL